VRRVEERRKEAGGPEHTESNTSLNSNARKIKFFDKGESQKKEFSGRED